MMLLGPWKCAPLSPFFALARCIGVTDFRGKRYHIFESSKTGAADVTLQILDYGPRVLIAGFVPETAYEQLTAAGIDVRVGQCSVPAATLAPRFRQLPRAALLGYGATPSDQRSHRH